MAQHSKTSRLSKKSAPEGIEPLTPWFEELYSKTSNRPSRHADPVGIQTRDALITPWSAWVCYWKVPVFAISRA